MAGIGFELRKVVTRGDFLSFAKAAFSGTMIVAGPWILSILSLTLINQILGNTITENPGAFFSAIVYCYAFSIVLPSGFQFIFTRYLSDLLYEKKECQATLFLIYASIFIFFLALVLAVPVSLLLPLRGISQPWEFRIGLVLLFAFVNVLWLVMLYSSILKWYLLISVFFLLGGGISLAGVWWFGTVMQGAAGGALFGFALGTVFTVAALLVLGLGSYPPERTPGLWKTFWTYFGKFKALFWTGIFFNAGIWADKVIYWYISGTTVPGTFFNIFPDYDSAVYFANLTIIPGLIYFVVITETGFYIKLKKFLIALSSDLYTNIQRKKYLMLQELGQGIRNQSLFQAIATLSFIVLAGFNLLGFFPGLRGPSSVLVITLVSVFFHLLLLTLLNFLFYVEAFDWSRRASLIFLLVNCSGAAAISLLHAEYLAGSSYLLAAAAGALAAGWALRRTIRKIDQRILAK